MFSPMVAMASAIAVSTVPSPTLAALIFSTSAPTLRATCAIILTSPWNCSLRATKSVSELTSTTTPLLPDVIAPIRPSAATRPAFFAAFDRPFLPVWSERGACVAPCRRQLQECRNREIKPVAGRPATRRLQLFRFRGHCLGLGNPAIGAAPESDLFPDLL